jgi:hypothetical protein
VNRLFTVIIALWPVWVVAQEAVPTQPQTLAPLPVRYKWHVKNQLSAWINPARNTALFSVERRIRLHYWWSAGAGYIFDARGIRLYTDERYQGVRVRGGLRYIFDPLSQSRTYIGVELKGVMARHHQFNQYDRQGGAYREWVDASRRFRQAGLGLVFGSWIHLGGPRSRFFIEPTLGLGVAYRSVRTTQTTALPVDAQLTDQGDSIFTFTESDGDRFIVDLPVSLNIGYRF